MYSAWRKLTNVLIRIAPVYLAASISIVSANNEDLVWEIIDASGMVESMEVATNEGLKAAITPIAQQLEPLGECGDPVLKALESDIASLMTLFTDNTLLEATAKIYAEKFSEDELRAILEFYQTSVGKKLKALAPDLAMAGAEAGQKAMMDVMPSFQSKIHATMVRVGSEAQQCMAAKG
jgi:hypothetical protein